MAEVVDVVRGARSWWARRPVSGPPGARLQQVLDAHVGQVLRGVAAFRLTAALVPLLDPNGSADPTAWRFVLAATAAVVALNAALWVLAPRIRRPAQGGALLFADLGVAVAVNTAAAVVLPGGPDEPATIPFWYVLQGTVAVTVAVRGPRCAVPVLLVGIPLQVAMARLAGLRAPAELLARGALGAIWLVLALVCAVMVVRILRLHAEVALDEGVEVGADREQVRTARSLHDTVLQTLEAIALRTPADEVDPATRLRAVRELAREQADELRAAVEQRRNHERRAPRPFSARLADVTRHALRTGVETDVVTDVGVTLPPAAGEIVCDAVREALTNVAKHSGVRRATVRVHGRDGGALVVVEDRGLGFDPEAVSPGFGVAESIVGRVRDAGGDAHVTSRPGRGTTVWISVPRGARPGRGPAGRSEPEVSRRRRAVPPPLRAG